MCFYNMDCIMLLATYLFRLDLSRLAISGRALHGNARGVRRYQECVTLYNIFFFRKTFTTKLTKNTLLRPKVKSLLFSACQCPSPFSFFLYTPSLRVCIEGRKKERETSQHWKEGISLLVLAVHFRSTPWYYIFTRRFVYCTPAIRICFDPCTFPFCFENSNGYKRKNKPQTTILCEKILWCTLRIFYKNIKIF